MNIRTRLEIGTLIPIIVGVVTVIGGGALAAYFVDHDTGLPIASIIALAFALVLLLIGALFYEISRNLIRRLSALEDAASRIRKGDFSDLEGSQGKDEIGEIVLAFNEMVGELRSYVQLTKKHEHVEGELRVARKALDAMRNADVDISDGLERLQRAQAQLLHRERLNALSQMFAGIGHDVNERLMAILGRTELSLLNASKLDPSVKGDIEAIRAIAQDLHDEFDRLIKFHSLPAGSFGEVDVNSLADEAIALSAPKWDREALARGATIVVRKDYQAKTPVRGDRQELLQALLSVIFNAVEAMPKGGCITFRTENRSADTVLISVSDTGVGMSADVRRRCCRPFFSTKEDAAGIGLSVVAGIVREHSGKLGIVSEPGNGTTVMIELPTSEQKQEPGKEAAAEAVAPRSLSMLVVEDDPWVGDVVVRGFTPEGHKVDVAMNGREGLDRFRGARYDVIITDRAMPEMSGYELAAAIRQTNPSVPIIMLTGFADAMGAEGKRPSDIDRVVGKPVTLARLREIVFDVVRQGRNPGRQ
jgi:signal transduction histidine kinase/CheY-like chemotaxis protein